MASIKYSGLVTEIKGSIGGTTFKGTRTGFVIQNKITKPPTTANGAKITKADAGRAMQRIAVNVQGWKGLTDSQRNAWNMAAPNFPFKDKFGNEYTPSGYQLYQSINCDLQIASQSPIDTPPTPDAWANCPTFTPTYDISTSKLTFDGLVVPHDYLVCVFMTRPLSAGNKGGVKDFRLIYTANELFDDSTDMIIYYQKIFGAVIPTNNSPFYGKIINKFSGRGGMIYSGNIIVS